MSARKSRAKTVVHGRIPEGARGEERQVCAGRRLGARDCRRNHRKGRFLDVSLKSSRPRRAVLVSGHRPR